jgi:glycosyltransferase involved in cell wall biosynthesis
LGVVFHDVDYQPARGVIRQVRVSCQKFCIRTAFRCAEFPILTVPASQIPWLPRDSQRASFIPVGANFPPVSTSRERTDWPATRTVAVFGVTGGAQIATETRDIAQAMKQAAATGLKLRLDVFGRNAIEAEPALRKELGDTGISLSVAGVLPAEKVCARLCEADVLLFVRGPVSSRRGSALAGIVCGTPVVGYRGAETAPPITEAGVVLVAVNDSAALAKALTAVLTDAQLNQQLRQHNSAVTAKYLSWDAIASEFAHALGSSRV